MRQKLRGRREVRVGYAYRRPLLVKQLMLAAAKKVSSRRLRKNDPQQLLHRIIESIHHSLLERDDRVIGDLDMLWAHFCAALRDVAVAQAKLVLHQRDSVAHI